MSICEMCSTETLDGHKCPETLSGFHIVGGKYLVPLTLRKTFGATP